MNKHAMHNRDNAPADAPPARPARQTRLHRLLFAGAALGTTIRTLGATAGPKIPPFVGE